MILYGAFLVPGVVAVPPFGVQWLFARSRKLEYWLPRRGGLAAVVVFSDGAGGVYRHRDVLEATITTYST